MCDTIIEYDVTPPEFVYKVVVVNKQGKMASCVMLEDIPEDKWVKAKAYPSPENKYFRYMAFVLVKEVSPFFTRPPHAFSSEYNYQHSGFFGVFKHEEDAKKTPFVINADNYKIAKFGVRGRCHETLVSMDRFKGYLVEEIKFVKFV